MKEDFDLFYIIKRRPLKLTTLCFVISILECIVGKFPRLSFFQTDLELLQMQIFYISWEYFQLVRLVITLRVVLEKYIYFFLKICSLRVGWNDTKKMFFLLYRRNAAMRFLCWWQILGGKDFLKKFYK